LKIIAGIYKGRNLLAPEGIRPTQGKARKAIFDILGDVAGLSFLELFAGSGAVGFEALSWGASDATLVEAEAASLRAIKGNIAALNLKNCRVLPADAERGIRLLSREGKKFDLIFLDPPYYKGLAKKTLQTLSRYDILSPYGFVIIQHFKSDKLPDACGELILVKQSSYGDTRLSIYRKYVPESNLSRDI